MASDRSWRLLAIVFTGVVGSFLVTQLVSLRSSKAIETLSESLVANSAPAIERLAALRASTLHVELVLSRYIHEAPERRAELGVALDAALETLDADVHAYLVLPPYAGETRHWHEVERAWTRFDRVVRDTRHLADGGRNSAAAERFRTVVEPGGTKLVDVSMEAIEFNARNGREFAARIRATRAHTVRLTNALTLGCVLLGIAGAVLIQRAAIGKRVLVESHARELERRAAELELFAGRVAHDIRNPLSSARLAAELVSHRAEDERIQEPTRRIVRGLSRAEAITSALLDFARAGGRADPGARTSPCDVIDDFARSAIDEAERAAIELTFRDVPPVLVACSTGVYLSLLGNLVRNAIKFMGSAETRRIVVEVVENGDLVRTIVTDTGPGIPADVIPSLFEPYFRGRTRVQDGIGLGLATVKKLAEGHGGSVGVSSTLGKGSRFWFDLPRAGSAATDDAHEGHDPEMRH